MDKTAMTMKEDRFRAIVEAYGADVRHWPAHERAAAQDFAAREPVAAAILEEAQLIDRLLDEVESPSVSPELERRILAALPQGLSGGSKGGGVLRGLWPGRPLWVPAAAFAASLACGVVAAFVLLPQANGFDDDYAEIVLGAPGAWDEGAAPRNGDL